VNPAASLTVLLLSAAFPFQDRGTPTGEEVLARMAEAFEGIDDYTVTMDIVADLERLKVPPMTVTMYYKRPDKVHFDSDRFALLPREGVALNPERLRARFNATAVAHDTLAGRSVLRVTLKPKNDKTGLRAFLLDVDPVRWTPERMITPLFDGRTMTATLSHVQVDGRWLPSQLAVRFTSTVTDTVVEAPPAPSPIPARPSMPRRGTITVRYSGYRVNTGLSDDLFRGGDPIDRK
jgi:outer membrane lipoprotein-sorting protein